MPSEQASYSQGATCTYRYLSPIFRIGSNAHWRTKHWRTKRLRAAVL